MEVHTIMEECCYEHHRGMKISLDKHCECIQVLEGQGENSNDYVLYIIAIIEPLPTPQIETILNDVLTS